MNAIIGWLQILYQAWLSWFVSTEAAAGEVARVWAGQPLSCVTQRNLSYKGLAPPMNTTQQRTPTINPNDRQSAQLTDQAPGTIEKAAHKSSGKTSTSTATLHAASTEVDDLARDITYPPLRGEEYRLCSGASANNFGRSSSRTHLFSSLPAITVLQLPQVEADSGVMSAGESVGVATCLGRLDTVVKNLDSNREPGHVRRRHCTTATMLQRSRLC